MGRKNSAGRHGPDKMERAGINNKGIRNSYAFVTVCD